MKFELFVALRYLKAKRKQTVISVITVISILGVTSGVMALIVALSISAGFREDLQNKLLRGTSHINVLPKEIRYGISNYPALAEKIKSVPGVQTSLACHLPGGSHHCGTPAAGLLKGNCRQ